MKLRLWGMTAVAVVALTGASMSANAVTLTGASLNTSDVIVNTGPSDTTATLTGGVITLGSSNTALFDTNNPSTWLPALQDAGSVTINNGTTVNGQTIQLGTLNGLLSSGASFNVASNGGNPNTPYWQVVLGNGSNTILINDSSSAGTGIKSFGVNGASASVLNGTQYNNPFGQSGGGAFPVGFNGNSNANSWSTIAGVSLDGLALGSWNVLSVSIADGGFDGSGATSATIDSITLPSVAAVPEPSTWAMMMLGFAGLGVLSYRRSRRNGGVQFRFA